MRFARFVSTAAVIATASVLAVASVLAFWESQSPAAVTGLVMMSVSAFWAAKIIRPRRPAVRAQQPARVVRPSYPEVGR